ncbi:WD40 repeat domain-containing protein [Streptomyces sp. NPDC051173]|uniref:WD40 repeat domain-containing protein n=1 Tax=Streptomyces sp. NPDC051173 TaxID=3155164 RepID=UPI00344CCB35
MNEGHGLPEPRQAFAERFDLLYREAGNPLLRSVSASVARTQRADGDGRPVRVPAQRISDWRGGRAVPARFEPLAVVLTVLIGEARRIRSRPVVPGLYDLADWRARWQQATRSPFCGKGFGEEKGPPQGPCPYRGLAAYQAEDARWFFGREQDTAALVGELSRCLDGDGLLILFGASGAGKSSLLRAGLLPVLASGALPGSEKWLVAVLTPTVDPIAALVHALSKTLACPPTMLQVAAETGPDAFRAAIRQHLPDGRRIALIIDQFEETFTLVADRKRRDLYLSVLRAVTAPAGGGPMALAVLGLRADFYQHCLDHPDLLESVRKHQLTLAQMSPPQLARAIRKPAEAAGLELEEGLLDVLLRDLGLRDWTGGQGYEPGALPLLSHVLLSTWQQRADRRLTLRGYRLTGGLHGSIAQAAERAWAAVNLTDHGLARQVLLRLVRVSPDAQDARRRVTRAELLAALPDSTSVERLLDDFATARLLILTTDTVELTHEALLSAWPRLREWIEQDRSGLVTHQRLEHDAETWATEGHDPALLYRGARLELARSWADLDGERFGLSPTSAQFLATSTAAKQAAQQAERRRIRLLRALTGGLAMLLTLALIAFGTAYSESQKAKQQSRAASAAALANQAGAVTAGRPDLGMFLSASAYKEDHNNPDALSALLSTSASRFEGRLTTNQSRLTSVAMDPDGPLLAVAGPDAGDGIDLFDRRSRRHLATIHQDGVGPLAFAPHGHRLSSAPTEGGGIDEWDVSNPADPHPLRRIDTDAAVANSLAFSKDGTVLASACKDGLVRLWNPATGTLDRALHGLVGEALSVAVSPDGRLIAGAGRDSTVRVWHRDDGEELHVLDGLHHAAVTHVTFSPDSRTLATSSDDYTVGLWDVASGTPKNTPKQISHSDAVFDVEFNPDGSMLATASYDQTVGLWNTGGGPVERLTGHVGHVNGVAFTPDGKQLASVSSDGSAVLWDISDHMLMPQPIDSLRGAAMSPDGQFLATGGSRARVEIWRRTTGEQLDSFPIPHSCPVWKLAYAADGHTVGITGDCPDAFLYDTTRHRLTTLHGHTTSWARAIAFDVTSRTAVTIGDDNIGRIWNTATGEQRIQLPAHSGGGLPVAVSRDGVIATWPGGSKTVRLWDLDGHPLGSLPAQEVWALAFDPSGQRLAVASTDRTIRLWQIGSRMAPGGPSTHPLNTLSGHTGNPRVLAFSPDGTRLASAGDDRTIRLWKVPSGGQPITLTGHANSFGGLAFTPDGQTLASGNLDGTFRFWNLAPKVDLQRACERATRLTQTEWARLVTVPYVRACS